MEALGLPNWVQCAMRGFLADSGAAVYLNGTVFSGASLRAQRGIRQACPTSGPIWALLFDPVVRRLVAALPSPHDSRTCFVDDRSASLLRLSDGVRRWMPVFFEACVAIGLELHCKKCAVVTTSAACCTTSLGRLSSW